MTKKILIEEIVSIYNIEITFLDSLEECGLLSTNTENEKKYISLDDIPDLERFVNWHYDLEVNIPGLEIINNLLKKIESLEEEKKLLMSQIGY
ncbi:MAG: chaperone modulator CbpM [Saprospiraceae bacterium]